MKNSITLVAVLMMLALPTNASASEDVFWNGTAGSWSDPSKWLDDSGGPLGHVPSSAYDEWVTLDVSTGPTISSAVGSINNFTIGHDWHGGDAGKLTMTSGSLSCVSPSSDSTIGDTRSGTLDMSGGTLTVTHGLTIANAGGPGMLNMTGGAVTTNGDITVKQNGKIQLDGGQINCAWLELGSDGAMDVTTGTAVINWDTSSQLDGWIASGQLTAYAGLGLVNYVVDDNGTPGDPNDDTTTVTGVLPDWSVVPQDKQALVVAEGGSNPDPITYTITNNDTQAHTYDIGESNSDGSALVDYPWLSLNKSQVTVPSSSQDTVTATIDIGSLTENVYTAYVKFNDDTVPNPDVKMREIEVTVGPAIVDGLWGRWRMEEGNGTTTADSAFVNDGTLYGSPLPAWVAGVEGSWALSFAGEAADAHVDCNGGYLNFASEITVMAWVKSTSSSNHWAAVVSKGGWGEGWQICNNGYYGADDGRMVFQVGGTSAPDYSGTPSVVGATDTFDGEWHHVCGVYDGSHLKIYVDGQPDGSETATGTISSSDWDVWIGGSQRSYEVDDEGFIDASIDDARIYDRALSDTEIAAIGGSEAYYVNPQEPQVRCALLGDPAPSPVTYTVLNNDDASARTYDISESNSGGSSTVDYPWLSLSATQLVIAPQSSDTVDAAIDPSGLAEGDYSAYLKFRDDSTPTPIVKMRAVYLSVRLAATGNLLANWELDEGTGSVAFDSVGCNYGTLKGVPGPAPAWVPGAIGPYALAFTGEAADAHVDCGASDMNLTSEMTVSAWLNSSSSSNHWGAVASKGGWGDGWQLCNNGLLGADDGLMVFQVGGTTAPEYEGTPSVVGATDTFDGKWHHVVGVYDGVNLMLYVDGQLDGSEPATGMIDSSSWNVWIGGNHKVSTDEDEGFFDGSVDDVRIYDRALDPAEVKFMYGAWPDADNDGDVDQGDFAALQRCFTGDGDPEGVYGEGDCRRFDREPDGNPDGDVDELDFGRFEKCATGPDIPLDPENLPLGCEL